MLKDQFNPINAHYSRFQVYSSVFTFHLFDFFVASADSADSADRARHPGALWPLSQQLLRLQTTGYDPCRVARVEVMAASRCSPRAASRHSAGGAGRAAPPRARGKYSHLTLPAGMIPSSRRNEAPGTGGGCCSTPPPPLTHQQPTHQSVASSKEMLPQLPQQQQQHSSVGCVLTHPFGL